MALRGVRGATTVERDEAGEILAATRELLEALLAANPTMRAEDLASAWFTLTPDLRAAFPAQAARGLGWRQVAMLCAQEVPVPGSLPRCIRVLLHWNTPLGQEEIHPVYLRAAVRLRPDLAGQPG